MLVAGLCAWALAAAGTRPADAQAVEWTPPAFEAGSLPETPIDAVAGGEVLLEVEIDAGGLVTREIVLRETPPFTAAAQSAVAGWVFRPAEQTVRPASGDAGGPVTRTIPSKVLVAYIARPPALFVPTLGDPPVDIAPPSDAVAYPATTAVPAYPPLARDPGVGLIQVAVDEAGRVSDATVLRSAPGFDDAGLDAVRLWRFRPARIGGSLVTTRVYVVLAWRTPAN